MDNKNINAASLAHTTTPETDKIVKDHQSNKSAWSYIDMVHLQYEELEKHARSLERQRNEAHNALWNIRNGYGGQIASEECGCDDCEFLLKIDKVIKAKKKP